MIKGIGSALVESLVSRFGEDTLNIIEKTPEKLLEIDGIGKQKTESIDRAWKKHHAIRSLMLFLAEHGLNASLSAMILKEYGRNAEDIIRKNPYCMATEIDGIDFHAADLMAIKFAIPANAPERIKASILYLIERAIKNGDVFIFEEKLIKGCSKLTGLESALINDSIAELEESGDIIIDELIKNPDCRAVYSKIIYQAEKGVSEKLKALLSVPVMSQDISQEKITKEALKRLAINLSQEQLTIIEGIIAHRVAVITGGPGTGKTTIIRAITAVFEILEKKILLAAPTGRAARRLSEVTSKKAATIHKMLCYNQLDECFEKNRDNPLEADVLIIDEASMVDVLLMFHLIDAIPLTSVLIMVGDIFQLPSIGPGNILSDIIKSGRIKTFELKKIFRQARESQIIINAHNIRNGKQPDLKAIDG
ncbi:MAG: AAA family ATPase, partial [Deltaproteobacteria bacterium]|nr:AAA family ATPase [Deltaproteobacteria bacterium]